MSKSHDKLPTFFWVQLALAALVGIVFLITFFQSGFEHDGNIEKTAKNLEPVGAVSTKDTQTSSDSGKARSGKEVYNASCMACHASGVANAPKLGDKAAWEPRVATGLDALIKTAVNGKGAMPARGGNPAVTDEEIKAVILYMTGEAGFDLSSAKKAETTPAPIATTTQKEAQPPMPAAVANAIKKAPEPAQKMPEAVATAIAAVSAPTAPSAPAAPSAPQDMNEVPAKPTTPETSTEKMEKTEVAVASTTNATDSNTDNEKGRKVYKSACFACHDAGVAGSPKIGDKTAWTPRIATGNEALYVSAINGKGVMPPKGGNMGLSDDAVKSAVNYMMAQSK